MTKNYEVHNTNLKKAKIIAFYLPQFHPIIENDIWWGKGFTEWTNVTSSKPLFKGHYQPQLPADLGFYDLRLPEVRNQQAEMAKEYGIEGFCYWHYWFGGGRRILEMPFNEVLKTGKPDFPFCLAWANHSWSNKTWESKSNFEKETTFLEQKYPGKDDYVAHFNILLSAFKDERYMKIDNKPIFLIFDPFDIPETETTIFISTWNELAKLNGFDGMFIIARVPSVGAFNLSNNFDILSKTGERYKKFLDLGFNAINSTGFRRAEIISKGLYKTLIGRVFRKTFKNISPEIYNYKDIIRNFFTEEDSSENVFPTVVPRWDKTPRMKKNAYVYHNSNPDLFKLHLQEAVRIVENKNNKNNIIFLQAWNEWGEGNYIEPDIKYGRKYLEVIKEVVFKNENK